MPACLNCTASFPAPTARRGKVQIFCTPKCRVAGANARRASTRAGRINGITYPHAGEPSGRPLAPEATNTPESVDRSASDSPSRLDVLMALAHSRGGIDPWQVAELAKLRGISAWAPLAKIIGKETKK
jgi:hypothetical protein